MEPSTSKLFPTDSKSLENIFSLLKVSDPKGFADGQLTQGLNHLGSILFLREMWDLLSKHNIDKAIRRAGGIESLSLTGEQIEMLHTFLQDYSKDLLARVCQIIDYGFHVPELDEHFDSGLFQLGEGGPEQKNCLSLLENFWVSEPETGAIFGHK